MSHENQELTSLQKGQKQTNWSQSMYIQEGLFLIVHVQAKIHICIGQI